MRTLLFGLLGLVACGGNVVVDHGGSGGSATTSGPTGSNGSASGTGGGPTGVGGETGSPACDAPSTSPSDGVCFTNIGRCNPVTGAPCFVQQGQSCDIGADGFACFDQNNVAQLCGHCDNKNGPFCGPGLTCLSDDLCARWCCHDEDCGTGFCDKSDPALTDSGVGVCKARSH